MKLTLDSYNTICNTRHFEINGIKACCEDFGEKYDASPDAGHPHMCCNMVFRTKKPEKQVLEKYGITADEYSYIAIQLRNSLSFGLCKLCV